MDGLTDLMTDSLMNGWTDGHAAGWMDRPIDEMDGQIDWMDVKMGSYGRTDRYTDWQTDRQRDAWNREIRKGQTDR